MTALRQPEPDYPRGGIKSLHLLRPDDRAWAHAHIAETFLNVRWDFKHPWKIDFLQRFRRIRALQRLISRPQINCPARRLPRCDRRHLGEPRAVYCERFAA